jgi:hypothetical protein
MVSGRWGFQQAQHGVPAIGGGGLAGVLCVAVILFVSLIPFFAFRFISRELGADRLNAMLFSAGTTVRKPPAMQEMAGGKTDR